jgi:hypothetical protein
LHKPLSILLFFSTAVAFLASNIWGRMAERTYDARMSSVLRWFLMPGRLRERDAWVQFQKVVSWFGLFFFSLVYVLALISLLS